MASDTGTTYIRLALESAARLRQLAVCRVKWARFAVSATRETLLPGCDFEIPYGIIIADIVRQIDRLRIKG